MRVVGFLVVAIGLIACVTPPTADGPSDAGLPRVAAAPHAPCIMQEGGLLALDCQAIDIMETTIPLVAGGTAIANVKQLTPTPTQMMSASITGPAAYTFSDPACMGMQACTFSPNKALPYMLGVQCTTAQIMPAILQVVGINGASDVDSAQLTCAAPGPTINVSPSMIPPLSGPVGVDTTAAQQITVTNNGVGTLSYTVSNGDPQWTLTGNCATYPNCMLAGGGGTHTFTVHFTPTMHHLSPVTDTFTFDGGSAGMPTVQVMGTGTGAILSVAPTVHDFLQLARNAVGTQEIVITNQGNAPMNVTIGGATPPFAASAASFANIMPGGSAMFDVTCQSATQITPAVMGSITISSNAYQPTGGSQTVSLRCEVLPTDLQVTPNPVDFKEVRKGAAPAPTIDVTLFNGSAAAENVTGIQLVGQPSALTLTGAFTGSIAAGASRTVTLKLATGSEIDVAGSKLEVSLSGQPTPLAVPVQGKVVVPSAKVVPEKLDLGTACIAAPVTGVVRMINDGTATLKLDMPTMDQAFAATSNSTFPLSLGANEEASVEVMPAMATAGSKSGVLTWSVEALSSPYKTFTVPVELTYIPVGTAVSPAKLEFGELDVSLVSRPASVTLRNCDPDPVSVRVEGLVASRGNLDAWSIEPALLERTLASQETLTVAATFAPKRPGHHEAKIRIRVGDEEKFVDLIGDALGDITEKTSLYACDCSGAPRPWAGWPIGLALVIVLRRRRGQQSQPNARS